PDLCLLATQYSLSHHADTARDLFPLLDQRGMSIVVGAPFDAGLLSGKDRYLYGGTLPEDKLRARDRMRAIAAEHGVDLRTAALQLAAAPPVVSAVLPGARGIDQIRANVASMSVVIPAAFWTALRDAGLIAPIAPTPQ